MGRHAGRRPARHAGGLLRIDRPASAADVAPRRHHRGRSGVLGAVRCVWRGCVGTCGIGGGGTGARPEQGLCGAVDGDAVRGMCGAGAGGAAGWRRVVCALWAERGGVVHGWGVVGGGGVDGIGGLVEEKRGEKGGKGKGGGSGGTGRIGKIREDWRNEFTIYEYMNI